MPDLAIDFDSSAVDKADERLNRLAATASKTEGRIQGLVTGWQQFSQTVGGAAVETSVVKLGDKLHDTGIKGEFALGRIERNLVSMGATAAGLTGEGGHIAHLGAALVSLGEGGAPILALIGVFTLFAVALEHAEAAAKANDEALAKFHKSAAGFADDMGKKIAALRLELVAAQSQVDMAGRRIDELRDHLAGWQKAGALIPDLFGLKTAVSEMKADELRVLVAHQQAAIRDLREGNKEIQNLVTKFTLPAEELDLATQKQLALNEVFGRGAGAVALVNAQYELMKSLLDNAKLAGEGFTKSQIAARDEAARAAYVAAVAAAQLEEGEQARKRAADDFTETLKRQVEVRKQITDRAITADTLNAEAAANIRLAAATLQGRDAADAMRITLAGEAAVRADLNKIRKEGGFISDQELERDRQAAEAKERGRIALEHSNRAESESVQIHKQMLHELQQDFSTFFQDLANDGLNSFTKLFDAVRRMFVKLAADMAAAQLFKGLIASATGAAATGADAAGAAGAGAGAAAGAGSAAFLPIAAVAIGLSVLNGVISWMHNAAAAAEALAKNLKEFTRSVLSYEQEGTLEGRIQAERDRAQALRDQALALEHQTADVNAYYAAIDRINAAEALHVQQLQDEAKAAAAAARDDLQVRLLRAQGRTDEADAAEFRNTQAREWLQAVKDSGLSIDAFAASVAGLLLAAVQEAEAQRRLIVLQQQKTEKELEGHRAALAAATQTTNTLRAYALQLRVGSGSQGQNVDEARRQFDDLVRRARAGDQQAAQQLPQFGQQFLDLARNYYGSTQGYQDDLKYVMGIIDELGDKYDVQRQLEQEQVDLLQKILDELSGTYKRPGEPHSGGGGGAGGDSATSNAVYQQQVLGGNLQLQLTQAGFREVVTAVEQLTEQVAQSGTKTAKALERVGLSS